jgi:hypothetical protein
MCSITMKTIRSTISRNCLINWNQSKIIKSYTEILLIAMVLYQGLSNPSSKKQKARRVLCRSCLDWRVLCINEGAEKTTILMTLSFWARLSSSYLKIASRPTKNKILCCLARVEQTTVYLSPSWFRRYSKTVSLIIIWFYISNLETCLVKAAQSNSSVNSKNI